jgi:hypothetical protein
MGPAPNLKTIVAKVPKRLLREQDGMRIFLVSGEYVRNHLEIDFTLGSHWVFKDSPYIPEGEVWIEETLAGFDREAIIFHEVFEAKLMRRGVPYEKAHARATEAERKFRKRRLKGGLFPS